MKVRKTDRLAAAILAILLLMVIAAASAQLIWKVPVEEKLETFMAAYPTVRYIASAVLLLIVCVLLLWSLGLLFRRRKDKAFVPQKAEDGSIDISIAALKRMVDECLQQHPELECETMSVTQVGSGVAVELKIALVRGVSVPLTVSDVQKQIRRYVTACSGLEVREVHVQVDRELTDTEGSFPYAITDMLQPALPEAPKKEEEQTAVPERHFSVFEHLDDEVNMPPSPEELPQPAVPEVDDDLEEAPASADKDDDDEFEPFDEWSIPGPGPVMSTLENTVIGEAENESSDLPEAEELHEEEVQTPPEEDKAAEPAEATAEDLENTQEKPEWENKE